MDDTTKNQLSLHVAGATVRHRSPFEDLETYSNDTECDLAFLKNWVTPVYLGGLQTEPKALATYKALVPSLTSETLLKMLGDFNWRPRIAGAYYAAISNDKTVETIIGTHLLKSEVCYAGSGYCIALAAFETASAQEYLRQYLEYYLQRFDLDFDQSSAIGALAYLDDCMSTDYFNDFDAAYEVWRGQADHRLSIEEAINGFNSSMESLAKIREAVGN